jgi:hypothetical protein
LWLSISGSHRLNGGYNTPTVSAIPRLERPCYGRVQPLPGLLRRSNSGFRRAAEAADHGLTRALTGRPFRYRIRRRRAAMGPMSVSSSAERMSRSMPAYTPLITAPITSIDRRAAMTLETA